MTQLNAIKFIGMNLKWKEIFMDQNCSFFFVKIIIVVVVVIKRKKNYTTDSEHASIVHP